MLPILKLLACDTHFNLESHAARTTLTPKHFDSSTDEQAHIFWSKSWLHIKGYTKQTLVIYRIPDSMSLLLTHNTLHLDGGVYFGTNQKDEQV